MSINLLEDVAPASNELGAVADLAQKMHDLENEIVDLEKQVKAKKQALTQIAEQDLPDLMQELNIRDFTLTNGAKVEVKEVVSGSIPSNSAIDRCKDDMDKAGMQLRQEQCFDYLREQGAGALIKSNVEVQFGREEDDQCNQFVKELQDRKMFYKRNIGVHPASLNSYIREQLEAGKNIPHDLFKLYEGRRANIRR